MASVMIAEMAAYWKARGKTPIDAMNEIYGTYGYYLDRLDFFSFRGLSGMERIGALMERFRKDGKTFFADLAGQTDYRLGMDGLPAADVLKFRFTDGSWLAVRPSGTEPKIKFYYSVIGKDPASAKKRLQDLQATVTEQLQ